MGLFSSTPTVLTDEKKIDELLSRSVAEILPTKEAFKQALMSGTRLRFYIGTDATGPQLHIGHATNYLLLEKFRQLGHEIIILFGDYTALIGDPTDKDAARPVLSVDDVNKNIADWKAQMGKIVDFSDRVNPAKIMRNSEWLSKLNYEKMIELASAFTVQHMLERDMFERRMHAGKPVYLHEFLYPLAQGYDSVAMNVDVEMGGTDQTFNMLAGRILQRKYNHKEKFVIATTLLENPLTGKKLMSKSEGSYIALNDSPSDMYGKVMALPDEVTQQVFVDCTLLSLADINHIMASHPKDAKMRLAREIVALYHDQHAARRAEDSWVETFSEGGVPSNVQEIKALGSLRETLVKNNIVASNTEFTRLLRSGAIRRIDKPTGEIKISSADAPATPGAVFRIGKHRFLKITLP